MQNRLRDSGALQHAFGELAQLHAFNVGQTHALQDFLDAALAVFAGNSRELSVVVEQFVGGQVVVEVGLLGQKADLRFDFRIGPFVAQNASRSGGGEHQPHQHFQCRGFARAVGTEEAENLSLFHGEMQRLQGPLGALAPEAHHVGLFQSEDFNRGHCGSDFVYQTSGIRLQSDFRKKISKILEAPERGGHRLRRLRGSLRGRAGPT